MAVKKKPVTDKATPKQKADERREADGKLKQGAKLAEKWTEKVVLEKLNAMYKIIAEDDTTTEEAANPVRANSIKLQKEVCLMVGITSKTFAEWKEKFTYKTRRNYTTNEMEENETYSESISELIEKLHDICECRLQYSGLAMDMFILKNHYGFRDTFEHDVTSKGEAIKTVAPIVTIIEQH